LFESGKFIFIFKETPMQLFILIVIFQTKIIIIDIA